MSVSFVDWDAAADVLNSSRADAIGAAFAGNNTLLDRQEIINHFLFFCALSDICGCDTSSASHSLTLNEASLYHLLGDHLQARVYSLVNEGAHP